MNEIILGCGIGVGVGVVPHVCQVDGRVVVVVGEVGVEIVVLLLFP